MAAVTTDTGRLIDDYLDALDAGEEASALAIARQIPLAPGLAKGILLTMGKKFLMANFDLSEANERYGEGWMDE